MRTMQWLANILTVATIAAPVLAQVPAPIPANDLPFTIQGALDAAALSSPTLYNSGGTITVNGWTITVPNNLLVAFPAAFIPFKDFTNDGHFIGYEVQVVGNVVGGKPIAGIIKIAQFLAEFNSGYISAVNFDGTIQIQNGPTIRINDPNGVYGVPYTARPFMTADDQNPSISAFSGFPMCIPRSASDSLCPASNRPGNAQGTFSAPDPLVAAPFLVGDYVEFSGFKDGGIIVCYSIVATNVQILTTGNPTYLRIEDAIIGVFDGTASEFADTKFIGYTSDSTASFTLNAVDIDPCTGATTDRVVGSATIRNPAGDPRNKFVLRFDATTSTHYTREYRLVLNAGQTRTKNNILAGQYVQPVVDWEFPEPLNPATPPPVLDFSQMDFLTKGVGPDSNGNIFGPLQPFPMSTKSFANPVCAPPPATTTTAPPVNTLAPTASATASPGPIIISGKTVTLIGTNTNTAVPAGSLNYTWSILSAASSLTLSSTNKANTSFVAPATAGLYAFNLKICSPTLCSNAGFNVTVVKQDTVSITSYTWTSQQGGTIGVTAKTNIPYPTPDNAVLTLCVGNTCNIAMTNQGNGLWSYNARSTKKPTSITVTSSFGGSASATQTTAKKRNEDFARTVAQRRTVGNIFYAK